MCWYRGDNAEEGGAEGGAPRDKVGAFHAIEEAGPRDIEEGLDLRGRSRRGAWARVCTRACAWHVHARGRAHARADGPMGRFKRNHNTSVLLLLMAKGAQGLTLTEANHVFLLHPIMNPQQEAQAVNRVRRIGQTKPTFVHRYLVVDSVEVSIHERQQRGIQEAGGVSALLAGAKKQKAGDQHQLTLEDFGSFFHDHDHVKESAQERDHAQHG